MKTQQSGILTTVDGTLFAHLPNPGVLRHALRRTALALLLLLAVAAAAGAQVTTTTATTSTNSDEEAPLIIEGGSANNVFGFGRSVIVRGNVKDGVMAFGGDVIVEGRVEGDVGAVGGSVIQGEGAYIGGDVFIFGGAYHNGGGTEGRKSSGRTIMFAGFEQELRDLSRDPASLLTPRLSLAYMGHRLLAVLFWFIVSLALTAVIPGTVSRAAARLQMTSLRVAIIGLVGAVALGFGVPVSLWALPPALGGLVGALALVLLVVAYLFGRVVIHAATGRWLQRLLLPEGKRSESVALLFGALFWAVVLTMPYVWPFFVTALVVTSLGLSLTARYHIGWKRA